MLQEGARCGRLRLAQKSYSHLQSTKVNQSLCREHNPTSPPNLLTKYVI